MRGWLRNATGAYLGERFLRPVDSAAGGERATDVNDRSFRRRRLDAVGSASGGLCVPRRRRPTIDAGRDRQSRSGVQERRRGGERRRRSATLDQNDPRHL